MSEYQIVPYTFHVTVAGMPDERRNLADYDGSKTPVLDFIANALRSYGDEQWLPEAIASTSFRVVKIARSDHVLVATVENGRRGIAGRVARMRDGKDASVDVIEKDWTLTPTRCVFFAPPGHVTGLALFERAGATGARTSINNAINETVKAKHSDLRFIMAPAMSPEYVERWAAKSEVKGILLRHTDVKTGESAREVHGLPVTTVFKVTPPRRKRWTFKKLAGTSNNQQLAILTEVVPQLPGMSEADAAVRAAEMIDGGWTVALEATRGGKTRTVQVESHAGISLTFPAGPEGAATRPTHDAFMKACQDVIRELNSSAMSVGDAKLCTWADAVWQAEGDPWKVVWGVRESESDSGPS